MIACDDGTLQLVVDSIGAAVAQDRITALAPALVRLRAEGAFDDDRYFVPPAAERYSRTLIWSDPGGRFVVIGMSWAPGQTSPLHDHCGLWGAEILVSGCISETAYVLRDVDARKNRYVFTPEPERQLRAGDVGIIAPPLEYHFVANHGDAIARTVHVYCGDLAKARTFEHVDADCYTARSVDLRYDA